MSSEAEARDFTPAGTGTVERAVDEVLAERADFVNERGLGAIGPLMGVVMQKLGGSADGKKVNQVLKEKIGDFLNESHDDKLID
jgi:glutamyl-tRNA(Gln) amidotransferase subunit E